MHNDIKLKGHIDKITIDEKFNIIDGFTRDEILKLENIEKIKYDQYKFETEQEKIQFIESKNIKRRHLTEYQRFETVFPDYQEETIQAEQRQKSGTLASQDAKGKASAKAAKKADMSPATFERCLTIKERADSDQLKKVTTGKTGIKTLAVQLTRKDRNSRKYPLPKTISDVMLVDFPYQYGDQGGKGAADEHYDTMPTDELIKEFKKVAAAENSIIFAWFSPSFQYTEVPVQYNNPDHEGCAVIVQTPAYKAILDAGKFKVIGEFTWDKEKIGVGSWNRNQHENLLIAVKGNMPVPLELFSSIIKKLRTAHSKKPNLWPMIKKMYPKRNYCELYAREETPGVLYHGNEIKKKIKGETKIN